MQRQLPEDWTVRMHNRKSLEAPGTVASCGTDATRWKCVSQTCQAEENEQRGHCPVLAGPLCHSASTDRCAGFCSALSPP